MAVNGDSHDARRGSKLAALVGDQQSKHMSNESPELARRAEDRQTPLIIQRLESLERTIEKLTDKLDKRDESNAAYLREIERRLTQTETRVLLWGGGGVGLIALAEVVRQLIAK